MPRPTARTRCPRPALAAMALLGILGPAATSCKTRPAQQDDGAPSGLREQVRHLVLDARDKVFPALVNIHVVTVSHWGGKEDKGSSVGSGTIMSADGYIVTNYHVTADGRKFRVTLADKQEIPATLIGEDPLTDLAVVKINPADLKEPGKVPVAEWGNSDDLQVGDYVLAMGSPFALSRSVTLGIVSNTERVFTAGSGEELEDMRLDAGEQTGIFTRWIQHDAAINPGNSGGPLVNLKGEVIGVNELGGSNMGFAIPSDVARAVAAELIRSGDVPRSWIGLSFRQIGKTGLDGGVLVNSVVAGGPAARAGLQAGDVITALDGKPVTVRFVEEIPALMKRIAEMPVGTTVRVAYTRDHHEATAAITTERLLKGRGKQALLRAWGLSIQEITERMARDRRLDSTKGALVSGVRNGSPAETAEPSLNWGDVIRAIDGKPVGSLQDAIDQYGRIMAAEPIPEFVLVEYDRRGKNQVTVIKPRPDKRDDPPREIPKGWIGVATQPVFRDLARQLGLVDTAGFRITRIYPESAAAKSGLKVGDVITAVNGEKLSPKGVQDNGLFQRKVRTLGTDGVATLTVLRDGASVDLAVPLERTRFGPEEARREASRDFDLTVRELTFFDRDDNRWDTNVTGVLVESAEPAGWAGLAGIDAGDLIQRINDDPVTDIASYRKVMEGITKTQPPRVVFFILRGVETQFKFVEPDWKPTTGDESAPAARPAGGQ